MTHRNRSEDFKTVGHYILVGIPVLAMVVCSVGTFFQTDPVCSGEKLVDAGKVEDAIKLYSDALAKGSYVGDPEVLIARAFAYRKLGKNDLALADLNQAEKICIVKPSCCSVSNGHSRLNDVYIGRARTYYNLGKYDQSIADTNRVFKTARDPDAFFERAIAYKALKKLKEAEGDLDSGLLVLGSAREERFYHERANILTLQKKSDAALADLNQALAVKDCGDAYFDRALILKQQNKLAECKADLTKAISIDPTSERALHERARVLMSEGNNKDALSDLVAAKKADASCELLKEDFNTVEAALKK